MSASPPAVRVATDALRRIGSYATYDTGPDPVDLEVAVQQFDSLIAYLCATQEIHWLRAATPSFLTQVGQADYDLLGRLTPMLESITDAVWIDQSGHSHPITLLRREEWTGAPDRNQSGQPVCAFITRALNPVMSLAPVPTEVITVRLSGQAFAPDYTLTAGQQPTSFPPGWHNCLTDLLAARLGGGIISRLPLAQTNDIELSGQRQLAQLLARSSREHVRNTRFVTPFDPYQE